ncbi:AAA family ATPase [Oxynema aestuarii]|uniref:AAA family ATPase n=1 Tax=Oxynema aestuarii AP17 TaxID=2064643 RepID=A0A6H1TXL4_9CYAN|nr:AAA family ATPase [Oxynema aestuarii]QIZ70887.1 AAA family ATPase [Oxynema aestuarii AP17]
MLDDIRIKNYRSFREFKANRLAPVNLIVGGNNSGKTSLLEAVHLLVNQQDITALFETLSIRGEFTFLESDIRKFPRIQQTRKIYEFAHLFYKRTLESNSSIYISSETKEIFIKITFNRFHGEEINSFEELQENAIFSDRIVISYSNKKDGLALRVSSSGSFDERMKVSNLNRVFIPRISDRSDRSISLFLSVDSMSIEDLSRLWDKITLTPEEDTIIEALKILEPKIERLSFTGHYRSTNGILLKLKGQDRPIPLGSMGDGMRRILNLVMSAVSVKNGYLLVDEIDTGLYYDVQTDMWRLIFAIAKQLNIQVFATTHSWDCVSAFSDALMEVEDSSIGQLLRLEWREDEIRAIDYSADRLASAVRQNIEVR